MGDGVNVQLPRYVDFAEMDDYTLSSFAMLAEGNEDRPRAENQSVFISSYDYVLSDANDGTVQNCWKDHDPNEA